MAPSPESQAAFRRRWLAEHPELARRVEYIRRELQRLDASIRTTTHADTSPPRDLL